MPMITLRSCLNLVYSCSLWTPCVPTPRKPRTDAPPPTKSLSRGWPPPKTPTFCWLALPGPKWRWPRYLKIYGFRAFCHKLVIFTLDDNFIVFKPFSVYIWPLLVYILSFYISLAIFWSIFRFKFEILRISCHKVFNFHTLMTIKPF